MTILAYLGPETMLPVTSIIAGALGFIMMFGRKAVEIVAGLLGRKPKVVAPPTRARGHRPTTSRNAPPSAARPHADAGSNSSELSDSAGV